MPDKKIIVVFGATGSQGGGLVRAIQADPSSGFAARTLTRNANSDKAKELTKLGAEVVAADVDDPASMEQAFKGAHGAFCVTFFWDHFSPEKEQAQAKSMAKLAKKAGLKHVVWSTLEDTRKWVPLSDNRMPTIHGKYKVPHFDSKGEADQFFRDEKTPTTFLLTSFYWDNLITFGMGLRKGADGKLSFSLPMGDRKLPAIAADDIGKCALGVFKKGDAFIGKTIGIAGEHLTGSQMANALARGMGQPVAFNNVPFDVYRKLGFPGAEDLGNMFQFKHDFNDYYCGARSLDFSRSLNPSLQTFDQWLGKNVKRIPVQ